MSSRIVGIVLDHYHGPAHLKLTLLAIADCANSQTGLARPSYDLIAGQTNVHRRSAIRNVAALSEDPDHGGVLEIVEKGGFRVDPETGRQVFISNVYRVRTEVLELFPHWRELCGLKKPKTRVSRKAKHGDVGVTVEGSEHGDMQVTVGGAVDNCEHGDTHDTVRMHCMSPCHGDTGVTLTKTLEPSPKGQGLSTGNITSVGTRAAEASERRNARSAAREGLIEHHRRAAR